MRINTMVMINVRYNPAYKHFGPAMNKLKAESRCARVGPDAFMAELETFSKTVSEKSRPTSIDELHHTPGRCLPTLGQCINPGTLGGVDREPEALSEFSWSGYSLGPAGR
jgi:hypothetical protein